MKKIDAIKEIDNLPEIYMNNNQKNIAKRIIHNLEAKEIRPYYDFIMMRTDIGFKFDLAPETLSNQIAVVNQLESMNINVNMNSKKQENENILIIGDNYEALKNLLVVYREQVDVIYIHPPFNTEEAGKEGNNSSSSVDAASKLIYSDKYGRNGWLNMIRERLFLAKHLLKKDGILFISIDDIEHAYLKILCDEIFGENSFITNIVWKSSGGGKNDKIIPKDKQYILCYSNRKSFSKSPNFDKKKPKKYDKNDDNCEKYGNYELSQLCRGSLTYSESLDFIVYVNKSNKRDILFEEPQNIEDYYKIYAGHSKYTNDQRQKVKEERLKGIHNKNDWRWFWGKATMKEANKKGFLEITGFPKDTMTVKMKKYENAFFSGKECKIIKGENIYAYELMRDLLDFKQWITKERKKSKKVNTKLGKEQLQDIFSSNIFHYPTPIELIQKLIMCHDKKDAIVLDFFAGSGTTGHAVMQLNREDGGKRRFILVTNNENGIGIKITYERLYRIIKGESTSGSKDFNWCKNNKPFINTPLRIFNIKHYDVETNQISVLNKIKDFSKKNLKALNSSYDPSDIDIYHDLNGLTPLNEAQKKQIYSTDPIIHEKSEQIKNTKKAYCTCGASFSKLEDLEKHIDKNIRKQE